MTFHLRLRQRTLVSALLSLLVHAAATAWLLQAPAAAQWPAGGRIGLAPADASSAAPSTPAAATALVAPDSASAAAASPRPANAAGGARGGGSNSNSYLARVRVHLDAHKHGEAEVATVRGTVVVRFRVLGSGAVEAVRLAQGSGDAVLDRAALALVLRAAPLPAPPDGAARVLTVPIEYR